MGSCYKMLRPVNDDDLSKADPDIAVILKVLPSEGSLDANQLVGQTRPRRACVDPAPAA